MIQITVPYFYIDTIYALSTIALFIIFSLLTKIFVQKREIHNLKTLCKKQQEYCDLVNPDNVLNYFGIDVIKITVPKNSEALINKLTESTIKLRNNIYEKYGWLIPDIRIFEKKDLNKNEYEIYIRDILISKYTVDNFEPIEKQITKNLEIVCLNKIDKIFLQENAKKYIELAENKFAIEDLKHNLSIEDIRLILIDLIHQKVAIKDVNYIVERLSIYSHTTKNINELIQQLIISLQS